MARFRVILFRIFLGLALASALQGPVTAKAANVTDQVQTSWRLLDYIAVDYPGAVRGSRVVNSAEYQEMAEFSASVGQRLGSLPPKSERAALLKDSQTLQRAIQAKADAHKIAAQARQLGSALLAAYPVPLAPAGIPNPERGAALYAQNCASCHGAKGQGPTGASAKLNPPPIAFADRKRASDRSLFGLYQVISQGLEGTAMQSFATLPEEDRWSLAFHVGGLAWRDGAAGERIWREDAAVRRLIPDMAALVAVTPADLSARLGPSKATAVISYLRAEPEALSIDRPGSLDVARDRLRESFDAFSRGNVKQATELALSAYLDGFEPVEAVLATRDGALLRRVEEAMAGFRTSIARGESVPKLRGRLAATQLLLDEAEAALAPEAASGVSNFLGALTILLREGLEALLVVIAMLAFLRKADCPEAVRYVHGGWIVALLAGAGTWAVATYAIGVSGASRELTEGFGSLLAALILLSVGIWMHGKSQAAEWRRYIAEKMNGALSRGSAWFLFGLAFIVVYREVFETILFYAALWTPDNGAAIVAGALSGIALLGIISWAMLHYSRTLPITLFFKYSAVLIAILTVVLAGKGVGALQEAGIVPVTPLGGVPRVAMLGLFPTAEAIGAQLLALVAVILGYRWTRRGHAHPLPSG